MTSYQVTAAMRYKESWDAAIALSLRPRVPNRITALRVA